MSTTVARNAQPAGTEVAKLDKETRTNIKFLEAFSGRIDQLTDEKKALFLMALGERIGVRAELGELILYQGKPYICLDGRIRLAHATGLLVGLEVRPATSMERRNYGCADDVMLWVADAHRRGSPRAYRGWGEAGGAKEKNTQVAVPYPAKMAKKRARYDALRQAFPAGEDISPMHQGYIEAAEEEASRQRATAHPIVAAAYSDEAEDAVEEHGDEVAVVEAPTAGARPITEAQTARILALADHKLLASMKDTIEENLKSKKWTETTAASYIAVLETTISGPQDAGETIGELGLGDTRRKASNSAVESGR